MGGVARCRPFSMWEMKLRGNWIRYVENILPSFLVFGMYDRLMKMGYPQTPGIVSLFKRDVRFNMSHVFTENAVVDVSIVMFEVKDTANRLTNGFHYHDIRNMLLVNLAFTSMLAENGLHGTPNDPLPKLAVQEIQDFKTLGHWHIDDKFVMETPIAMLMRARMLGYYLRG